MRIEKATARDLPEVLALHAALTIAREHHVDAVFLLTTTAEQFFPKFGFERISRADVPASVQASVEFQSACPASAT
jgi:amino-acid N-acetyltransferase